MSSYSAPADLADHEILVGWDPDLMTFFIHVLDLTKDEDDEGYDVYWLGVSWNEVVHIEAIQVVLSIFRKAGLPHSFWHKLNAEAYHYGA